MGTALMADDRDIIIGELREGVRAIKEHLRRQDDAAMVRDQQKEIDKREAIKARAEKEERDEARFRVLDEKSTMNGGRVSVLEKRMDEDVQPVVDWHRDEGSRLGGRVSILEQHRVAEAAEKAKAENLRAGQEGEKRGFLRTWGLLIGAVTVMGGFLGWLGADKLSAILFSIAVRLGNHG